MIAEDLLERGLADAANEYDVPSGAVDRIREQLAPTTADADPSTWRTRLYRPSKTGWMVLSAASIVLVVIVAFAVGGGGSSSPQIEHGVAAAGSVGAPSPLPAVGGDVTSGNAGSASGGGATGFRPLSGAKAVHAPMAAPAPVTAGSGAAGSSTGSSTTTNGPLVPAPTVPDKVIKTGELDLQAPKGQVSSTLDKLTGLATIERGYVADSRTSEGGIAPSGEVTLRVPVAAFEDTIRRARAITGVKVLSLTTSGKDVTSKYVDLKARISALEKTRQTFLTLLSKATTIGETLAVQQHITDVQTQIEQLQGEKKVLVNQAALSTLTVTVDQKVVVESKVVHHKSGLHKAFDRSVSRFVHGIEAIVGIIGPVLLVVLLVALGWLAARFGYRALRRRMV